MKAAVVPEPNSSWQVQEIPTPEPGVNQVLIKVHASGLCFTDVHITRGFIPTTFPRVLGHEPAGEIVALGEGVTTRKVGDRVGVPWVQAACGRCEWCQRGKPHFCQHQIGTGIEIFGSHAEYMVAFANATVLLPEGLAYEQAAPIFCAGYTVYSGLRWSDPKPHDRIAVVGIGGLGHLALQYAKAAGFETIAITRTPDKADLIRELGIDTIVTGGEELMRKGGADVILATGNSSDAASEAMQGLRPDGRFVVMGFDAKPLQVSPMIIMSRVKIMGSTQNGPEYLYEALDYAAKGKVKVMAEMYSLDDVGKAYDRVAQGKTRFRAVIKI